MTLHEKFNIVKKKIKNDLVALNIPSLLKQSWSMSWPMMIIMFFEFIMNLTDVYIAGLLGKEIKAAVGLSTQVYSFFIMAGHAITMGTVSVVSKLYSSGDKLKFKSSVFTAVLSSCIAGAIIGILGITFSSNVINFLNAPESVKEYGITLLKIYSLGVFFHMMLINMNGVLRSCGNMKTSMYIMVLASILNILLNLYFIYFTDLGFKGIALSTAISILVSYLIALYMIYKILDNYYKFSGSILKQILSIGWPSGIISISWQISSTILFVILALLPNSVEAMAAYTTGLRIEAAIFMPAFAFNMANAVIVGNLMGQKRFNDAFKAGFTTAIMSVTVISIMVVIVISNAYSIASLLDKNEAVINEVLKYLYICMISEPFIALNLAMSGALNGAGDTKALMRYTIFTLWIVRIPITYIFGISLGFGSVGIWWALNIGFFIQSMLTTRRFISKKWQNLQI